jgi:hypothetical protein
VFRLLHFPISINTTFGCTMVARPCQTSSTKSPMQPNRRARGLWCDLCHFAAKGEAERRESVPIRARRPQGLVDTTMASFWCFCRCADPKPRTQYWSMTDEDVDLGARWHCKLQCARSRSSKSSKSTRRRLVQCTRLSLTRKGQGTYSLALCLSSVSYCSCVKPSSEV